MEETKDDANINKKEDKEVNPYESDNEQFDDMVSQNFLCNLNNFQFDLAVALDQLIIPFKKIDHNENFCIALRSLGERSPDYIN